MVVQDDHGMDTEQHSEGTRKVGEVDVEVMTDESALPVTDRDAATDVAIKHRRKWSEKLRKKVSLPSFFTRKRVKSS